jgi:hypothetical protein
MSEKITVISLIVTIIGGIIIPLLNAMYPNLFPNIGKKLKPHGWVIILLVLIIIAQQIFIYTN